MEYIIIKSEEDIPKGKEVLGCNFKKGSYGYQEKIVGYIHKDEEGIICCENNYTILCDVTHYVDIHSYSPEKQSYFPS